MATITKSGAPTRKTKGNVGDIWIDSVTGNKYKCTFAYSDFTGCDCEWKLIEKGNTAREIKSVTNVKEVKAVESNTPKKVDRPDATANSSNQDKHQYKDYRNQYNKQNNC